MPNGDEAASSSIAAGRLHRTGATSHASPDFTGFRILATDLLAIGTNPGSVLTGQGVVIDPELTHFEC